ncbi:MAG: metallophosphoesterase [Oscillospiraceae bacterium]|nr:metallophosphoesterase [Oscillospiraceae bacterium]
MKLFAISDLHLPGGGTKAMDVFGPHWVGHFDKIKQDWIARVSEGDAVLMPGDFSWAMRLADALPDLRAVGALPGRKVILRGNHDYWWNALGQLCAALPPSITALQNNATVIRGEDADYDGQSGAVQEIVIAGSRGWNYPDPLAPSYADDDKIYKRELIRLDMSIRDAKRRAPRAPLIIMTHYPPFRDRYEPSPMTAIINESGAVACVYGHLHGESGFSIGASRTIHGVTYHQVSCDGLGFKLKEIQL